GDWRARLIGRPRKAKPCTEINSDVTSHPHWIIYPICSSIDSSDLVMSQFLCFTYLPAVQTKYTHTSHFFKKSLN
ncbi:hypothetical protein MOF32_08450, partial [Priestia megaterium]|uniref:hypothetical protein n=1 Tax=Priestia megaterium TaxID=1404 RepID=UPI00227FAF01